MFKHLLVPLDGSRLAETALPAAAYVARAMGAKVTLLHIVERNAPAEIHGEMHLRGAEQAQRYLDEITALSFPEVVGVDRRVETEDATGIARRIQEYALALEVDLIVMCTHGHSGLRHLLSGSNAQQVIAYGRIPVLRVRPAKEPSREFGVHRVLAPLDGKPEHEQGLRVSAQLARIFGAELQILVVVPTSRTLRGDSAVAAKLSPRAAAALLDMSVAEAEEYVRTSTGRVRSEGLSVSGYIERGDAADAILRTAKRRQTDLIVVGTHRRAGVDAFWSGSVAPRVTNNSIVPVLLVPL